MFMCHITGHILVHLGLVPVGITGMMAHRGQEADLAARDVAMVTTGINLKPFNTVSLMTDRIL